MAAESSRLPGGALPLLILVVLLAAASVWLVGVPALGQEPSAKRTCEVHVLESGSTRCVEKPVLVSGKVLHAPKRADGAKR